MTERAAEERDALILRYTRGAQRAMDLYGYAVLRWTPGSHPRPEPGHVVEDASFTSGEYTPVPTRLLCIGHATYEDFVLQGRTIWRWDCIPPFSPDTKFFKVIAE